jgi:hypothetical protein
MLTEGEKAFLEKIAKKSLANLDQSGLMGFIISMNMNREHGDEETELGELNRHLIGRDDEDFLAPGHASSAPQPKISKEDSKTYFTSFYTAKQSEWDKERAEKVAQAILEEEEATPDTEHTTQKFAVPANLRAPWRYGHDQSLEDLSHPMHYGASNIVETHPTSRAQMRSSGWVRGERNSEQSVLDASYQSYTQEERRRELEERRFESDLAKAIEASKAQTIEDARVLRAKAAEQRWDDGAADVDDFTQDVSVLGAGLGITHID